MRIISVLLIIFLFGCQSDKLMVDETGSKGYRIKETTLRAVKWKHPFAKRKKHSDQYDGEQKMEEVIALCNTMNILISGVKV